MDKWKSVDDALDFAIAREQEAADFYNGLATNAEHAYMAEVFTGFAKEEMGHKARLNSIKAKGMIATAGATKKVADLKIGDYLVAEEANPNMDYQQALIVAMKREKAAYRLYADLAALAESDAMHNVFMKLAQEEARHKLRFEIEYDEKILTEN